MSQVIVSPSVASGSSSGDLRILVVQKDNIGDLVLVTPLLAELRRRLPAARIDVLASSYNCAVLDGNPNVDRVVVYVKRKHQRSNVSTARHYGQVLRLTSDLRRASYDQVFLLKGFSASEYFMLSRLISPRQVIGFVDEGACKPPRGIDVPVLVDPIHEQHIVRRSFHLLNAAFPDCGCTAISPESHPCRIFPRVVLRDQLLSELDAAGMPRQHRIVALQISARRTKQQWPGERFAMLARLLSSRLQASPVFFWSPGLVMAAAHPGDDSLAQEVLRMCGDFRAFGCRTDTLSQLIAGLSFADVVVSIDGGAMHVAAACGRPVVALFGDSDPHIWHPWCRSYRIVQGRSGEVSDIGVETVLSHVEQLLVTEPLALA